MSAFRYQATEVGGSAINGVIEAENRKTALQLLGQRGLFPSSLEICSSNGEVKAPAVPAGETRRPSFRFGKKIKQKEWRDTFDLPTA